MARYQNFPGIYIHVPQVIARDDSGLPFMADQYLSFFFFFVLDAKRIILLLCFAFRCIP